MESSTVIKTRGFSEEALRDMSDAKGEPRWLLEQRLEAWRTYQQMPMPSRKGEEWRRTDISMLDLAGVVPFSADRSVARRIEDLPGELRSALEGEEQQALLVQHNSLGSYRYLPEELSARGVIVTDLDSAVREHPDLVRRHLSTLVPASAGKFAALHTAFWSGGAFVYVPRNVEVELPVHALTWADAPGLGAMPHTLIVLEPGAALIYVDEVASTEGRDPGLANGVAELAVGSGAQLRYVSLQQWSSRVFAFDFQRAAVGRDARLDTLAVVLGSRTTKSWIESELREQGATTQMSGIMFGGGGQRFHHHTLQDHQAPNTTSDLMFKGALVEQARSEYSGLIRVSEDAQKTDAYQANRNLLLSPDARADSMPKLEIKANDVRCTHGATVGPLEPEQLFYLMARGLPRPVAERMIVQGFFEPVIERIPLDAVRDRVRRAVDAKLSIGR